MLVGWSFQQQGSSRVGMDVLYIYTILLLHTLRSFCFTLVYRIGSLSLLLLHTCMVIRAFPSCVSSFCVIITSNAVKLPVRFFPSQWSTRECKSCWQVQCLQWSNYGECCWWKWLASSGTNCKEWQNREVLLLQFPELCWAAAVSADFN